MSESLVDKILLEDIERSKRLKADFDPITGEGLPGERYWLEIKDFSIPKQYAPVDMIRNQLIQDIIKAGSIDAFIQKFNDANGTDFTHDRVEREIIKLREKHDFPFWAYFEIHIDDKQGRGVVPFKLNYAQLRVLEVCERLRRNNQPINIIICKARQWGGSTFSIFYQTWIAFKWRINHCFSVCAQVNGVAASITQMLTTALEQYKPWSINIDSKQIRLSPVPKSNEYVLRNAKGQMIRRNKIRIGSVENPDNLRGLPGSGAHFSEVSVWPDTPMKRPEDLVKSITGGILPQPYTMQVFESTPKGAGNYFHRSWLAAKAGTSGFEPVFIPWYFIPHDTLPIDNKREFAEWLVKNKDKPKSEDKWHDSGEYYWSLWEKGATLEGIQWYRYKSLEYDDHADMASEAPSDDIEAFQFSGTKVFNVYKLENLRRDCKDPERRGMLMSDASKGGGVLRNIHFVDLEGGDFKVWKEPDKSILISDRYLVAVDVGGRNETSDWSVVRVFDRFPMMLGGKPELVAQLRYHTDYDLLAYDAMRIAKWYNNALLVIESNTIDTKEAERDMEDMSQYLLDIIGGLYENLYARAGSPEKIRTGRAKRWGFQTNSSTKPAIIGNLIECVREHLWIERDNYCIEELALYEKNEKGQFSAPPGAGNHDDVVMTTAIALWICFREMETPRAIKSLGDSFIRRADEGNMGVM